MEWIANGREIGTQFFEPERCQIFVLLNSSFSVTATPMVRAQSDLRRNSSSLNAGFKGLSL